MDSPAVTGAGVRETLALEEGADMGDTILRRHGLGCWDVMRRSI